MKNYIPLFVLATLLIYSCKTRENIISLSSTIQSDTLFIYVSSDGKNEWSGWPDKPDQEQTVGFLATPQRAIEVASEARQRSLELPIVIQISAGTYYLDSSLVISETVSGSQKTPTII